MNTGYEDLRGILDEAYAQSAEGKGRERHANGRSWDQQPILQITRAVGLGFPAGQAIKKIEEAVGMVNRGQSDAAAREILGAIVYAAAAIRYVRETSSADMLLAKARLESAKEMFNVQDQYFHGVRRDV